ncbi:MAG: hypothetical protein MJA27_35975, partial [Pseudanabaenales cyanobacterium]|nr:hypothetical protein [Pseudanabaenales cyanobacterium]
ELVREQAANFYPDICRDDDQQTGIVDMVILSDPEGATLELLMADQVIATFTRTATATPVQDIRSTAAAEGAALRGLTPENLTIEWTVTAADVSRALARPTGGISYLVEISKDGGATWETVGFDQTQASLEIDPSWFEDMAQIQVRVTSSDGFSAQTVAQTIDL